MGVIYDYFIAPSDGEAGATLGRAGGPGVGIPGRGGLFSRSKGETVPAYPTVADAGIDPVVQAGTLEELLTGLSYDELDSNPKWGETLAVGDGGNHMVLTVTDTLVAALAQADEDRLAAVAAPWSETEEFWGQGDPDVLRALLRDLAGLARQARADGRSMYCWVSV